VDLNARLSAALTGRYEILREIGRGGMSVVFLARDLHLDREVALKALRPELTQSVGAERFQREIQLVAHFEHIHLLPLYESGTADGALYYVMPYARDGSLRDLLHKERQLGLDDVVRITREVAEGIAHAHERGVVHRDLKPENILFVNGHAVVADFGIAHAYSEAGGETFTEYGLAIGTPPYMSPEQAAGERSIDHRSDVYALGCVVYEMLTGGPPFEGPTTQAVLAKQMGERVPSLAVVRPGIPEGIVAAVEKALEKVPADRHQSVVEFADALAVGRSTSATDARQRGTPQRKRRAATAVLVACVAAAILLAPPAWRWLTASPVILDDQRIVVFPLSSTQGGGGSAVQGWEAALAIEEALERTEPLKWLDGWSFLPESTRAEPRRLTRDAALEITRAAGARFYITGAMRGENQKSVTLWLHDAAADTLVVPATHEDTSGSFPMVAVAATEPLLARLVEQGRPVDLSPLTDRKNSAIALTLQGDRAYRQARFLEALGFYKRAVAEDSLSALSAVKGAQAASWAARTEEDGVPLIQVALRSDSLLPHKYRAFVRGLQAHFAGDADSAVAHLNEALRLDGEWSEAWMALGQVYYDLLPSVTHQDSLAERAFRRAATVDSLFAPPLVPLAEITARKGDLDSTLALATRFLRIGTDSTYARELRFLVGCLERGPMAMEQAELGDSVGLTMAAIHLAATGARLDCAEAGYRHMLGVRDLPFEHWRGIVLGLSALLMARGRYEELGAFLDSAVARGYTGGLSFGLLYEALGSPTLRVATAAESLAGEYTGELYATAQPGNRWLLGLWQMRQGNLDRVAEIVRLMEEVAERSGGKTERLFADALASHLGIARGDTAAALEYFERLHTNFQGSWLMWQPNYTLAPTRLLQAEVLLARGRYAEADSVAAWLDSKPLVSLLPALPRVLAVRARIAERAGRTEDAGNFEERLRRLKTND